MCAPDRKNLANRQRPLASLSRVLGEKKRTQLPYRGMSFSLPKHVPSFDNAQRSYENIYWGSSGTTHQNGHTANGIGNKLGSFFDNRELPMYKDKPYSYGVSRRQKSLLRRKRLWVGATLFLTGLLYYLGLSSIGFHTRFSAEESGLRSWFKGSTTQTPFVDWDFRREKVKEAFILSWDGYERYAWGMLGFPIKITLPHKLPLSTLRRNFSSFDKCI